MQLRGSNPLKSQGSSALKPRGSDHETGGVKCGEIRQLGITRYETAFQLMHKLRSAMVRPNRDKIGAEWPLEMDLIYIGGQHKGGLQGMTDNTPVIIAVEINFEITDVYQ
jgi:hypothetical protein